MEGKKVPGHGDEVLRPCLDLSALYSTPPRPDLLQSIRRLDGVRKRLPALRHGDYRQLMVQSETLAFWRQTNDDWALVVLNSSSKPIEISLTLPGVMGKRLIDVLNGDEEIKTNYDQVKLTIPPCWGAGDLSLNK